MSDEKKPVEEVAKPASEDKKTTRKARTKTLYGNLDKDKVYPVQDEDLLNYVIIELEDMNHNSLNLTQHQAKVRNPDTSIQILTVQEFKRIFGGTLVSEGVIRQHSSGAKNRKQSLNTMTAKDFYEITQKDDDFFEALVARLYGGERALGGEMQFQNVKERIQALTKNPKLNNKRISKFLNMPDISETKPKHRFKRSVD